MVGKSFVNVVVWVSAACVGVLSADADVVTNTWITPSGGYWVATNETGVLENWAGEKTDTADVLHTVVDFALAPQTAIHSSRNLQIVSDGMIFRPLLAEGEEPALDPASWPTWWLHVDANHQDFVFCPHLLGYFPLHVSDGWLVIGSDVNMSSGKHGGMTWGPVRKEGNGFVRVSSFYRAAEPGRVFEIADGKVFPMTSHALAYTDVRVTNPAGEFVLTNHSSVTTLGALTPLPGVPVPLTKNELRMGLMSPAVLPGEVCGTGRVTAVARTLSVTNIQPHLTYGARAGRLRLDSVSAAARPFAHYDFEASLTADISGNGRALTAAGTVERVYDAERGGHVARFTATANSGGKLTVTVPGTTELTGDADYTISLWAKTASPCANDWPTMVALGARQADHSLVQFRFMNATCAKLLLGHWNGRGDITDILPTLCGAAWNPAEWHHYVAMREGGMLSLWVDGLCVLNRRVSLSMTLDAPAQISLGWLTGAADRFFHGDLDDVRIYSQAVGFVGAADLFAGREPPQAGSQPSDAASLEVPPGTKLSLELNGEIQLAGTPTLAATNIATRGTRGALAMPGGGTLTLTGTGSYAGGVTGSNAVVKDGAERLVLSGSLDHTGGTEVKGGILALQNPATLPPALAAYDFEDGLGVDTMGNGFNLTTQVGVTRVYDAERGGYVASFPGTAAQKLETAVSSRILSGNSDYTLSVWAKPDADCSDTGTFLSVGRQAGFKEIVFRYKNLANGVMVLSHWGDLLDFGDVSALKSPQGDWHHYVARRQGTTYTVYCDGVKTWEVTKGGTLTFEVWKNICLGRQLEKTDRQFKGLLDDVHIYACALDEDQIALLNGHGTPSAVARGASPDVAATLPAPLLHYAFETAGNPGFDSAAGAHHLTKIGAGRFSLVDSPLGGKALRFDNWNLAYLKSETAPLVLPTNGEPFTVSFWVQTANADAKDEQPGNGWHMPTFVSWGNPEEKTINYMWTYWHNEWATHGCSSFRTYVRKANNAGAADQCFEDVVPGLREGDPLRRWHHCATVYDPSVGMRHYVDGECLTALAHGAFTSDGPAAGCVFYLGVKPTALAASFRGALDEVKVFGAALDIKQIHTLMRADAGALRVLPAGGDVTIDEGATLEVNGTEETFGTLAGVGTFNLSSGVVGLTGTSTFDGVLKGAGMLRLPAGASLTLTQDPTGFSGYVDMAGGVLNLPEGGEALNATFRTTVVNGAQVVAYPGAVEIPDGAAIALTASQMGPLVTAAGTVTICGGGAVTLPTSKTRGTWVIARGTSVVDKESTDLNMRWTVTNVEGVCTTKFFVSNGDFVCRVLSGGTTIFVR